MGLLLAFSSALFSAAKDIVSKGLSFKLSGIESGFASFLFALPYYVVVYLICLWIGWESWHFSTMFWLFVVLRSLTDSVAESFKMTSFVHGDISLVSAYLSLSPIFVLLLSPFITGDRPSMWGAIGVLIATFGSLLMISGKQKSAFLKQKKGVFFALASSLFFALNTCFDRLAVLEAGPVSSGFAMTLLSAFLLLPFVKFRRDLFSGSQRGLWIRGAFEIGFMVLKLSALMFLQAPYVAGFQKLALLLTVFAGGKLYKEKNLRQKMLGASLIVTGGLLIVYSAL